MNKKWMWRILDAVDYCTWLWVRVLRDSHCLELRNYFLMVWFSGFCLKSATELNRYANEH